MSNESTNTTTKSSMKLIGDMVVCVDNVGGISKNNKIPWTLPSDMEFFRSMVVGKVCLMGRRTWDSISWKGKKFLLGNAILFVLTYSGKTTHAQLQTCEYEYGDWDQFVSFYHAKPLQTYPILVCGGEDVYRWCGLHMHIEHIYVTRVMKNFHCDRFFRVPLSDYISLDVSTLRRENDLFWKRIHYVHKTLL